jgi:hypothetical protein
MATPAAFPNFFISIRRRIQSRLYATPEGRYSVRHKDSNEIRFKMSRFLVKTMRRARPRLEEARANNIKYEENIAKFYDSLRTTLTDGNCSHIDSRDFTAQPKSEDTWPDGVHRKPASAYPWAEQIIGALKKSDSQGLDSHKAGDDLIDSSPRPLMEKSDQRLVH